MSDIALPGSIPGSIEPAIRKGPDLTGAINPLTGIIFGGVFAAVLSAVHLDPLRMISGVYRTASATEWLERRS